MIRRLQRKFICIVMLSLGLVILLLLGPLNLLKCHDITHHTNIIYNLLS